MRNTKGGEGHVTMSDVAKHVGVSMMTVSRALSNEKSVRQATREKVLQAVKELGYRPNISARSLAAARSYFLGLIYDNPSSAYMSEFLIGSLNQCRQSGYHVVVEGCGEDLEKWPETILALVKDSQLDGVILPPPVCDNHNVLEALRAEHIPHVRISPSKGVTGSPVVYMDDRRAARQITRYLIERGHQQIGFISGHPNQDSSHLRFEGFCEALREHDLPINHDLISQGYYSYKSGFAAAERILGGDTVPTAIFASNDDMAAAVYANAQKHNLRIPQDLSVVGFDDTPIAGIIWPALTTIRQPIGGMAAAAIKLLVRHINGVAASESDANQVELDFQMIERDSVIDLSAQTPE